jgi:hypothetical protein
MSSCRQYRLGTQGRQGPRNRTITLDALTPPMHAVSDFRARDQAAAQRRAVHGDSMAGGELDAVAVIDQILRPALADFAQFAWIVEPKENGGGSATVHSPADRLKRGNQMHLQKVRCSAAHMTNLQSQRLPCDKRHGNSHPMRCGTDAQFHCRRCQTPRIPMLRG